MKFFYFLCLTLLLRIGPAFAEIKDGRFYGGLGFLSYNMMKTTTAVNGEINTLGPSYYPLEARYFWEISSGSFFSPRFAYTFPQLLPKKTPDGGATTSILLFSLPYTSTFGSSWDWTAGIGILSYIVQGNGGTKDLPNGNVFTPFALPARTSSSRSITWEFGIGYSYESWRFEFETLVTSPLGDRRTFNFILGATYHFAGGS